jgi:Family of unknown function (DUF5908)
MPIEVREVVIKGTVTDGAGGGTAAATQGGGEQGSDDMIKACVEKVLEILKEKSER